MPLYLDEIYFNVPGKDSFKNLHDLIGGAIKTRIPAGCDAEGRPVGFQRGAQDHPGPRYPGPFDDLQSSAG